jgi:hypothetical protein
VANDPGTAPPPSPSLRDQLRELARRRPVVAAAVAALALLVLLVAAASTGEEPNGARAGTVTSRVRESRTPRAVVDSALDGPSDTDSDRAPVAATRWVIVRPAPARPGKHTPAPPSSGDPPPPPAPQAAPAPPAPEVLAPAGHAPLRPIITNNPYGTP